MSNSSKDNTEERILILTSRSKDASLTQTILDRTGINCLHCSDVKDLVSELDRGAGAILLPEEAVTETGYEQLQGWLSDQPPWSDIPLLVFARPGADSAAVGKAMDLLGNVTVLERPMRISALVSAVRTALRARQRQYQIRDHLVAREIAETKLRADDQRKDEFLAILAHELRNPLAPIRNALELMRMRGGLDTDSEDLRALMERQVDHMVRLVDDLLEVSRITRGKIELKVEDVDVAEIIVSAVETSRPVIDKQRHRLEISLPTDTLCVKGDAVRLAQVFANLLNNAAKYTEPGGLIAVKAAVKESWIEVSVQDSGVGISPEMLPRVFDMFAQIERSKERSQGGLGIGLTLVKSLVEMHGGEIEAHSEGNGEGSRFVVRLPRSEVVAITHLKGTAKHNVALGQRVFVVDDNRDAATTLGALLEVFGATVNLAFSGQEALDAMAQFKPTIVLLDLGMPLMSGHEVAKAIRSNAELKDVTIIALTGWGQAEDRKLSQSAGFDYHLVKPVDLNMLENLLHSLPSADVRKEA